MVKMPQVNIFSLTSSIQLFKCQVPAVAGALFNLNAYCWAAFSCLDENIVCLMR
jgi:uncharacterized membrane protein YfbV (UPF0208 family)